MGRNTRRTLVRFAAVVALAAPARAGLRNDIEAAIAGGSLEGAHVAISVIEAGAGTPVVDLDAGALMIPASNLKLLTTGAALVALGPDFRFRTRMRLDRDRLFVIGDGDPGFGDPELLALMPAPGGGGGVGMDVESFLGLWVSAVVQAGVTTLREIVIDDTVFDRERVHSTWPIDQLNRRYCAQVSGLVFHLDALYFYPEPRPGGRPSLSTYLPRVTTIRVRNEATSRSGPNDGDTVWVSRRLGTNDLTFYGNVKHRYRTPVPVTVNDMATMFGELFADRLRKAGVDVGAVRLAEPQEAHHSGIALPPVIETPIATAITRCNRDSQNLYAECLLKRSGSAVTGQGGSWLNGAAIVRNVVHARLANPALSSLLRVTDGSGLSRQNRVAPVTLTAWLNAFHNDPVLGPIFLHSLAVGGESGTLRRRPLGTDSLDGAIVAGKSGYINGVSCLSGYVTAPDGRGRCFSIMVNDLNAPVRRAKALQERIVALIAGDLTAVSATPGVDPAPHRAARARIRSPR